MNNKKLSQTQESILIGMQEALSYAKGKLKVKSIAFHYLMLMFMRQEKNCS